MKKISLFLGCLYIFLSLGTIAQLKNDVLLTINNQKVSTEEFLRIYDKNKLNFSTGEETSVDDYLELFINFKLKVLEAQKQGYDTTTSFLNEFESYKKQLAAPYLTDNETIDKLIKEAYDRMQYDVRASHILVKLDKEANPSDTIVAYEKAMEIRRRVLGGEPFETVARGTSDDPSVKNNAGDLGYFTVFQMIYPFENAVYKTPVGEINLPVRTRFGYHIVKVTDKRKAKGQVKVAHIMLTVPQGTSAEEKENKKQQINKIYHRIKQGENFTDLAKEYSDDKGSARNGGELPWFGGGRMVEEFEKASFNLTSNGEISQPVQTSFGWHIIKRIDRKEIPSFKEAEADIMNKVKKGTRADIAKKVLVQKLKKEYHFVEKQENIPVKTDTTDNSFWVEKIYLTEKFKEGDTLFTFLNNVYSPKDFNDYVNANKSEENIPPYQYQKLYNFFIENKILENENARLEEKYPEYKFLLKEYHDGMLLFEISDKEVWTKAIEDSVGLKAFYDKNKKNYMWDERWKGSLYYCLNEEVYNKVSKAINKRSFGKKMTNRDLNGQLNKEENLLKVETNTFNKGDNALVDYFIWGEKDKLSSDSNNLILYKGEIIKPEVKKFEEAKGYVISDYQNYLDNEWVKELREKYNIQVNQSVLSSIK